MLLPKIFCVPEIGFSVDTFDHDYGQRPIKRFQKLNQLTLIILLSQLRARSTREYFTQFNFHSAIEIFCVFYTHSNSIRTTTAAKYAAVKMCNRNFFPTSSFLDNKKLFFTSSVSDTESGREVTEGELLFCVFALAEFGSVFLLFKLAHKMLSYSSLRLVEFFHRMENCEGENKSRRKRRSRKRKHRFGRYVDWFIASVTVNALRNFERSSWTVVFVFFWFVFLKNWRERLNLLKNYAFSRTRAPLKPFF